MYRDDHGPIELGRRLGQGGEGTVYEMGREAVKIYTATPSGDQTQKLKALLTVRTATLEAVSAWPNRLVYNGKNPIGYVMPKIENHHPIGRVCLPASRKREFPAKPWGWLIHVARNLAATVDQIHTAGVVIGDLNDANIFVSDSALVRIVDVDSFQISVNGRSLNTGVGVPMYLPPELQGRDLRAVVRTKDHDSFSLAVLIFQLLMMGRHPWGGDYRSDKSIEDLIATEPFAYGRTARARGMQPPKTAPKMDWLQSGIAVAFEQAFSQATRPSARDWGAALEDFRSSLTNCAISTTHQFVPAQGNCPWCRLEQQHAIFYFLPSGGVSRPAGSTTVFAADARERELLAIALPENFYALNPKNAPVRPSDRPAWVADYLISTRLFGLAIVALTIIGTLHYGLGLLILGLVLFFGVYGSFAPNAMARRQRKSAEKELTRLIATWDELIAQWHAAGSSTIIDLHATTKKDIARYKSLGQLEREELQRLQSRHREIMLDLHLANFIIRDADLGLPKKAVRSLEAYGIQTAADIKQLDAVKVPRIGDARLRILREYRSSLFGSFVYDPRTPLPNWMTDDIKLRIDKERRDLEGKIPRQLERINSMNARWGEQKIEKEAPIRRQAQRIRDQRAIVAMWKEIPAF